jgi:hypothetical protein
VVPAAIVAVLAVGAILPRYRADAAPDPRPNAHRADLLTGVAAPDDLIVSLDLAASNVLFLTRERKIDARVVTFPAEILHHWGWFNADESVARGRDALIAEAAAILEEHRRAHPRGRLAAPHLKALSRRCSARGTPPGALRPLRGGVPPRADPLLSGGSGREGLRTRRYHSLAPAGRPPAG